MGEDLQPKTIEYFNSLESRLGYQLLLGGTKHFGYYPEGKESLSMKQAQRLMEDKLAQKLNLDPGSRVLDAGSGEGNVAIYLAEKYGLKVTGLDLLDWAVKRARRKVIENKLVNQVNFGVGDYSRLGFMNQAFDGIFTMETLVHVPDYMRALTEFYRVLKPGGNLALFEYSITPLDQLTAPQRQISELIIDAAGLYGLPHFTHGSFPTILEAAGFSEIVVEDEKGRVMPMLKRFYDLARAPYKAIKAMGLQRQFVSTTSAVEWFNPHVVAESGFWRYNIVTAVKP